MAAPPKKVSSAESLATISNVLLASFIVLVLYFGRELLVPLALAALLTFMLAPLATRFQRWLGRIGAVLFVVAMMVVATGAAGWVLTRQVMDLAIQLPDYKENIRAKIRSVQVPDSGPFSKVSETWEELKKDIPGGSNQDSQQKNQVLGESGRQPVPVEVISGKNQGLEFYQLVLAPVLGPLGSIALVMLLLIFMLLQREDLRNRMIRLIGQGRISATSRAMDDAGSRVSKYLLMQLVVNVTYGIPVAIGLYFIGVPNAILWGSVSAVLRFIPYVGPWIGAGFPMILSLTVSPDWTAPALTFGLFIALELFSNNVMEPWLYGASTGVTPVALIVAALVWTWLWGPVGLVLATPLTVCLVVMGRHIPKLAFLSVLLSDEEPLTPAEDCYHRLLRAGEHDETELVDSYLKTNPPAALFDSVLIPVLIAAGTDQRLGQLESEQLEFIERGLADILDDLAERPEFLTASQASGFELCILPAKAHRDELAAGMLVRLMQMEGHTVRSASCKMLSGELPAWVGEKATSMVCVSVVAPTSISRARYLCTRLRSGFPEMQIMVGLWGRQEIPLESLVTLQESGADEIVTTLAEAFERVQARAAHTRNMEEASSTANAAVA